MKKWLIPVLVFTMFIHVFSNNSDSTNRYYQMGVEHGTQARIFVEDVGVFVYDSATGLFYDYWDLSQSGEPIPYVVVYDSKEDRLKMIPLKRFLEEHPRIDAARKAITTGAQKFASAAGQTIKVVGKYSKPVLVFVYDEVRDTVEDLGTFLSENKDKIVGTVSKVARKAYEDGKIAGKAVINYFSEHSDDVVNAVKNVSMKTVVVSSVVFNEVRKWYEENHETIKEKLGDATAFTIIVAKRIGSAVSQYYNENKDEIFEAAKKGAQISKDVLVNAYHYVENKYREIVTSENYNRIVGGTISYIKEKYNEITSSREFQELSQKAAQTLSSMAGSAASAIKDLGSKAWEGAKSAGSAVGSYIGGFISGFFGGSGK